MNLFYSNSIVWLILILELLFEVYTRPPDYSMLIRSENAYLPSTVRHISNFHVWTELVALIFFVPEFRCLFDSKPCGSIYKLKLTRACIKALYGPDKLNAFYGHSYLCLMRLRIFGLVRHWEKMWLNNTFVRIKGKDGVWTVKRSRGLLIPQGRLHTENENAVAITESLLIDAAINSTQSEELPLTNNSSETSLAQKVETTTDDIHLTNASKIGTALLTTNAQRGLILM